MIIKNIKKQVLLSKKGNPYAKILLQFDEYRDGKGNMRWVSGFGNKLTWAWKIGDDVQAEIVEKEEGQYLNFSFCDSEENTLDVYRLPATVGFVLELLKESRPAQPTQPQPLRPGYMSRPAQDNQDIPFG